MRWEENEYVTTLWEGKKQERQYKRMKNSKKKTREKR